MDDVIAKRTLALFSAALTREADVLARRPELIWQQLHNRLQWADAAPRHRACRRAGAAQPPRRPPWIHRYTPAAGIRGARPHPHRPHRRGERLCGQSRRHLDRLRQRRRHAQDLGCRHRRRAGHPQRPHRPGVGLCGQPRRRLDRLRQRRPHRSRSGTPPPAPSGPPSPATPARCNGCAVSPDGTWIVSASDDQTLKIWDAATGAERATLTGHTGAVNACAVSPDGTWIVSASDDRTAQDLGRRHRRRAGHPHRPHRAVGGRLCGQPRRRLDRLRQRRPHPQDLGRRPPAPSGPPSPATPSGVIGCAVSPDGTWIVSASEDKTLKIWDAATGAERATLTGHTDVVNGCAVSPDGTWIVSASGDHTLKIWDAATGAERATLEPATPARCSAVRSAPTAPGSSPPATTRPSRSGTRPPAPSGPPSPATPARCGAVRSAPTARWIVSASDDHTLRIWDAASGAERGHPQRPHRPGAGAARSAPTARWIVSASRDQHAQDLGRGQRRRAGHPQRPHRAGERLCGEPRRHAGSSPPAPTRPSRSGTRPPAPSGPPSRGHTGIGGRLCGEPRRHAGSSPPAATRRSRSGTRPPAPSGPPSPATPTWCGAVR